jgi:hypothetical protein
MAKAPPAKPSTVLATIAGDTGAMPKSIPTDTTAGGVPVSPFYIAEQRGWALMNSLAAATEAVKKSADKEDAAAYAKAMDACWDGWHAIAAELDNMDGVFQGGWVAADGGGQ